MNPPAAELREKPPSAHSAVDIIGGSCIDTVYGRSGRSDPALALPGRRIEGQQTVSNDQKDLETKEIGCRFDPTTGMFELATRVHNYSLLNTGASVAVDFFVGDPRDPESFRVGGTATPAIPPQPSGDNEEDVSLFVDAGCDGAGSVAEGSLCIADSDCRLAGDTAGACVPMLSSPCVCAADSGTIEGGRCHADTDCRTGPSDPSGSCIAETRLFVQLDPSDVILERDGVSDSARQDARRVTISVRADRHPSESRETSPGSARQDPRRELPAAQARGGAGVLALAVVRPAAKEEALACRSRGSQADSWP